MEYTFYDFLKLLGSLGIFLYGMKIMSEGLQKVAGNKLRSILTVMTTNRFTGVLTGLMITALIQSSSAATVMVVSFVNAGLLNLSQSITVIMGANVGTTVTAWIISIFGFKVNIGALALPLIGLSIPLLFSGNSKRRSWGEFIVGFALLFMGLDFLKAAVPDIRSNPQILEFLNNYTDMGFGSILLFLLIGTILTIVVQSSSATMAITLVMCSKGWISFEIAAAMVMGENIGTTITANMAAMSANLSAKRAALAHFMFNIFGVAWLLSLFYPFSRMVIGIIESMGGGSPYELMNFINTTDPALVNQISSGEELTNPSLIQMQERYMSMQTSVSYALSLFHTIFNVINVCVMIWFVKGYVYVVSKLIRVKTNNDEEFQLRFITSGMLSTSELSLVQAKNEICVYAERTKRMFDLVKQLAHEKENSEAFSKLFSRIEKYESICDRMELEIANYLNAVADGGLGQKGMKQVRAMLTVVTEIESIGDSCHHIARSLQRKQELNVTFTPEIMQEIDVIFKLADQALDQMSVILSQNETPEPEFNKSYNIELEINNYRSQLRGINVDNINNRLYDYQAGVHFMDIVSETEKLGDYVINVIDAVRDKRALTKP